MSKSRAFGFSAMLMAVLALVSQARADDFYKGKLFTIVVGFTPAGGYDNYARVLSRYIGSHIPGNPTIVVKNMEGAGSLRLANWLYRVAPKDGSVFAIIGRGTGFDPLLGQQAAQFDGTKFTWIGSSASSNFVLWMRRAANVRSFDDLRNARRPIIIASSGSTTLRKVCQVVQPSSRALSSSSTGMDRMKAEKSSTLKARLNMMCRIPTPNGLSRPIEAMSLTCGSATTGNGMNRAASR